MKQKILKPILLLMIAVIVCMIPMLGYYPAAEGWYAALCSVNILSGIAWPVMTVTIFNYGGLLAAMKYGTMMATTGLCVGQYRRMSTHYSPFIASFITVIVAAALEGFDWVMNGMVQRELYGLIPVIMLIWSTSVIFTYAVQRFMCHIPRERQYVNAYERQQILKNDGMLKISTAYKNLASEIQRMSAMEFSSELSVEGAIEEEINESLCKGCENGQIQYLERAKLNYLWYNKMLETREAMAIQLNEMADLMESYTKPTYTNKKVLLGAEDYIRHKLRERKILARKIIVNENTKGKIEVRVSAKRKKKNETSSRLLASVISDAVGRKMRVINGSDMDLSDEYREFNLLEEVNFMTISGSARRTREDENISGDNFTFMEMSTGQTFMSICDGMGSGKRAQKYSEMIIELLERLLESGFSEGTALKLINSILLTGNQWQEPAAVDMALIDQYSGICQFLKLGAACTYIKRRNWVECIRSTSLPMGVLEEIDMETITKKLYDGDFVIMISDGIIDSLQCQDKEDAMGRIIMEINTSNPREMAMEILSRALEIAQGIPKDDMTVICTGIWDKI